MRAASTARALWIVLPLSLSAGACSRDITVGLRPGSDRSGRDASSGDGGGTFVGTGGAGPWVEGIEPLVVEITTLKCNGDCADVAVVTRGGHPPYTFEWSDGSSAPRRTVCTADNADLSVDVSDAQIVAEEFGYDGQAATAPFVANAALCEVPVARGEPCTDRAVAEAFAPIVKWSYEGLAMGSAVTPLVASLNDDNGDGVVNLEDATDVLVIEGESAILGGHPLAVIDGRTGVAHARFGSVAPTATPAIGDIDGDLRPDIVAIEVLANSTQLALAAFHGDGGQLWRAPLPAVGLGVPLGAIALADLDLDGSVDIIAGSHVFNASGVMRWPGSTDDASFPSSPVAADLDNDGALEVIWSGEAFRFDGTLYYRNEEVLQGKPRWHAVADLDGDGSPEIVVSTPSTVFVLDHLGNTSRSIETAESHASPVAVDDLDGDGTAEIIVNHDDVLTAYRGDLSVLWSAVVEDDVGRAGATAFDFFGDGNAEVVFGDEDATWILDGRDGAVLFMEERKSPTNNEYPVIADVDDDGSADIVLVGRTSPALQVLSHAAGGWVPARRIMNQETYHVTNVDEAGGVPARETPHWQLDNSFRSQAQINADGEVCLPVR